MDESGASVSAETGARGERERGCRDPSPAVEAQAKYTSFPRVSVSSEGLSFVIYHRGVRIPTSNGGCEASTTS